MNGKDANYAEYENMQNMQIITLIPNKDVLPWDVLQKKD